MDKNKQDGSQELGKQDDFSTEFKNTIKSFLDTGFDSPSLRIWLIDYLTERFVTELPVEKLIAKEITELDLNDEETEKIDSLLQIIEKLFINCEWFKEEIFDMIDFEAITDYYREDFEETIQTEVDERMTYRRR